MAEFDWEKSFHNDSEQKKRFHAAAKRALRALADEMGFDRDSYDLRSNMGGPAVSGEITLHHHDIYIQASRGVGGSKTGLLIRTCENRQDYTGGRNHFAPLAWLNEGNTARLKQLVTQVMEQKLGFDADAQPDKSYHPVYSTPTFNR